VSDQPSDYPVSNGSAYSPSQDQSPYSPSQDSADVASAAAPAEHQWDYAPQGAYYFRTDSLGGVAETSSRHPGFEPHEQLEIVQMSASQYSDVLAGRLTVDEHTALQGHIDSLNLADQSAYGMEPTHVRTQNRDALRAVARILARAQLQNHGFYQDVVAATQQYLPHRSPAISMGQSRNQTWGESGFPTTGSAASTDQTSQPGRRRRSTSSQGSGHEDAHQRRRQRTESHASRSSRRTG
jgi:hypothetical protein